MVDRPFRFGVIAPKCGSGKELTEWARRAEALGYSAFFVDLSPTQQAEIIARTEESFGAA